MRKRQLEILPGKLLRASKRFARDTSGSYAILVAFIMPALIGTAGLGAEYGLWVYKQHSMQSAADSAAISAAIASSDTSLEAQGVAAAYGFVNGSGNTTVTVNQPPSSGTHSSNSNAIEVVIQQKQQRLLSGLFGTTPVTVGARAVALSTGSVTGCVLALDGSASGAITFQGSTQVSLTGCALYDNSSNGSALSTGGSLSAESVNVVGGISGGTSGITTTKGIHSGSSAMADPYASVSVPSFSGCTQTNFSAQGSVTLDPGVYCNGMSLTSTAVVTLKPGVYYIDQGSLFVRGGATLQGTGVTLVFTSSTGSNWANATIQQNANINLTAPTSGATSGLIMFGDRSMTTGTAFKINGGSSQSFGGAIYLPKAALSFTGASNSGGCTQLIADTITFSGNSTVQVNCTGYGTTTIGSIAAVLSE